MKTESTLKLEADHRVATTFFVFVFSALTALLAGCASSDYTYSYTPGTPRDTYVDERTGEIIEPVPDEQRGSVWPQKY